MSASAMESGSPKLPGHTTSGGGLLARKSPPPSASGSRSTPQRGQPAVDTSAAANESFRVEAGGEAQSARADSLAQGVSAASPKSFNGSPKSNAVSPVLQAGATSWERKTPGGMGRNSANAFGGFGGSMPPPSLPATPLGSTTNRSPVPSFSAREGGHNRSLSESVQSNEGGRSGSRGGGRASSMGQAQNASPGPQMMLPVSGAARDGEVQIYAAGFKYVLNLPKDAIHHLPPANLNVTRLVLCSNYDARAPETSCPMGERCKFVHADTSRAREHNIHVNYAWRSLEDVTYERFPAGQELRVALPNSKPVAEVFDSALALKTKALESTRRPLSHCAHYYFNRTCNLGSDCKFVHSIYIDSSAKQHQRAPIPSMRGGPASTAVSKRGLNNTSSSTGAQGNSSSSPLTATAPPWQPTGAFAAALQQNEGGPANASFGAASSNGGQGSASSSLAAPDQQTLEALRQQVALQRELLSIQQQQLAYARALAQQQQQLDAGGSSAEGQAPLKLFASTTPTGTAAAAPSIWSAPATPLLGGSAVVETNAPTAAAPATTYGAFAFGTSAAAPASTASPREGPGEISRPPTLTKASPNSGEGERLVSSLLEGVDDDD